MKKPVIGIIGGTHGLGNWFKSFFQNNKYPVLISGRKTKLTNIELTKKSDVVIVSVPIEKTSQVIKEILPFLNDNSLLMDFTSVKTEPLNEMKKAKKTIGVVGLHPLFGPLVTNISNQYIAVCMKRENKLWKEMKKLFEEKGATLINMTVNEHDKQMAVMQALLHFVNLSYVKTLCEKKITPEGNFSTPVFQLQTMIFGRILGQNPNLYANIQMRNSEFKDILRAYAKIVNEEKEIIEKKDEKAFVKNFNKLKTQLDSFIKASEIKTTSILEQQKKTNINIDFSEKKSKEIKNICYFGPKGTHTHTAASLLFPSKSLIPSNTISSIFEKITNNEVDAGLVPAENSTEGIVCETFDNLVYSDVFVNMSFKQLIHHNLLSRTKDINSIKVVVSHPQAVAQTREWMRENLPKAQVLFGASTTKVIDQYKDNTVGFIGSIIAAKEYNLNILKENIEDLKGNTTEFYLISKNKKLDDLYKPKKTLLVVTAYERMGVLKDILCVFFRHSINLTKLFSRPGRTKQWDYYFFMEAEVNKKDPVLEKVMDELKEYCPLVKVLGGTD